MINAKVSQFEGRNGSVKNQFLITEKGGILGNFIKRETFQSYDSIIATKTYWDEETIKGIKGAKTLEIVLDEQYWDYSTTTGKYRNQFLGEDKATTEKKIKSGEYTLENLNK